MSRLKDLTGMKFGKLTVVGIDHKEKRKNGSTRIYWYCLCDCGNITIIDGEHLKSGNTRSCGCLNHTPRFEDLTGEIFGRLTVVGVDNRQLRKDGRGFLVYWKCHCECGKEKVVLGADLKSGKTKSCGCYNIEKIIQRSKTHGLSHGKIYNVWRGIKQRCFYPNHKDYKNYGGRGVTMYPAWINDFQSFYDYVSKLPRFGEKGYSLDRINNDGNYEPDNLRWATSKEQSRNTSRNVFVEYEQQKLTLADASAASGVNIETLRNRVQRGETGEYLFRLPTSKNRK